jgi:hypothetical protein
MNAALTFISMGAILVAHLVMIWEFRAVAKKHKEDL